jgi:HK97 family phage portal protein
MSFLSRLFRRRDKISDNDAYDAIAELAAMKLGLVDFNEQKALDISQLVATWQRGKPKYTTWDTNAAVDDGYHGSSWVYTAGYRFSKAVASVEWNVERGSQSSGWEPGGQHPLADLIENPNPFVSRQDYMERLTLQCLLAGECFQYKARARKIPKELWILDMGTTAPIPSKVRGKFLDGYEQKSANGQVINTFKVDDVIHQMMTDPGDKYRGLAPLKAAGKAVDTDSDASDWQKNSLQNQAVPSGLLAFRYPMTQKQLDHVVERLEARYMGTDNARRIAAVGNDARWQATSMTPLDMDWLNGRKFSREEILAVLGVPPPIAGVLEDATLANMEVSRLIFWLDTVIPFLEDVAATWNRALTPDFGPGIRLMYDLSKVDALLPLFREHVDLAERLWRMGVPLNTLNRRLGLGFDPIPGGDVSYVQGRFEPRATVGDPPEGPEPEPAQIGTEAGGDNGEMSPSNGGQQPEAAPQ